MVEINLLPWREEEKRYQRKHLQMILASALMVSLLPVLSLYLMFSWQEKEWLARVDTLSMQLNSYALPTLLVKKDLSSIWLDQQNKNKALWVALANTREERVCFNKIMRVKQKIFFQGETPSAYDLTRFVLHWQAAKLFSEIKIDQMEKQKNYLRFQFQAV